LNIDLNLIQHGEDGFNLLLFHPGPLSKKAHCPVHSARIHINKAQLLGQQPGHGAFARAGRAVYGNLNGSAHVPSSCV
jgi:hypothetical protein